MSAHQTELSLKISGSFSYLILGDINSFIVDLNNYNHDRANLPIYTSFSFEKEYRKFNFAPGGEGEVRITLSPRFALALGTGYLSGKKESTPQYSYTSNIYEGLYQYTTERTFTYKTTAIPILLSLYFNLPLKNELSLFLKAGGGYYLTSLTSTETGNYTSSWKQYTWEGNWKETQEASSNGFGFHGGFGLEYNISKNLVLVFEGIGRYAKIKNFEGDYSFHTQEKEYLNGTLIDTWEDSSKEHGKLYFYEWRSYLTDNWYKRVDIWEEEPAGSNFQNIRKAIVDFSGFALCLGIRIKLF